MKTDQPRRPADRPARARAAVACVALAVLAATALPSAACTGAHARPDGLDIQTLPEAVRPDYEVFADRCSRCHTLARPLNSGISDMNHWRNYVARMRRQPNSGIAPSDVPAILRFLQYFSDDLIAQRTRRRPL